MTGNVFQIVAVVIGAIAGVITIFIWFHSLKKGKERNIQLVFRRKNKSPCKHARVRITGLDHDLSTTPDGDITHTVGKNVKMITGIIYDQIPFEFNVILNNTTDHYLIDVVY